MLERTKKYNLLHAKRALHKRPNRLLFSRCHHRSSHVINIICCGLLTKYEHGEANATLFLTATTSTLPAANMWTFYQGSMTSCLLIFPCDGQDPPWTPSAPAVNVPACHAGTICLCFLQPRVPGLRLATATATQRPKE